MGKKGSGENPHEVAKVRKSALKKPATLTMGKKQAPRVSFDLNPSLDKTETKPKKPERTEPAKASALKRAKSTANLGKDLETSPGAAKKAKAAKAKESGKETKKDSSTPKTKANPTPHSSAAAHPKPPKVTKDSKVESGSSNKGPAPTKGKRPGKEATLNQTGLVTPPTKRVSRKSPEAPPVVSSTASSRSSKTRTAEELSRAKARAEKALMERSDLEEAARAAAEDAEFDAAGMGGYLELIKKGHTESGRDHDADTKGAMMECAQKRAEKAEAEKEDEEEEQEEQEEEDEEEVGIEEGGQEEDEDEDEEDQAGDADEGDEGDEGNEDADQGDEDDGAESEADEDNEQEEDEEEAEESEEEEGSGDDAKDEKTGSQPKVTSAGKQLAEATDATKKDAKMLKNSKTNKREWDKFTREATNKRTFPTSLCGAYRRSKVCLFNTWLENDMSWEATEIAVERSQETKNLCRNQMEGVQAKELKSRYGEEKAGKIMAVRRAQGLYYPDDSFGDDPEEWGDGSGN